VTNRVTIGTHMHGRQWTLADVNQEVKRDMHQLKELRTWLRDEEAKLVELGACETDGQDQVPG
jgi:hypothetical protein